MDIKLFGIPLYTNDVLNLLFRLTLNILVLVILIRFLYYTKSRRKDYLFTYFLFGMVTFFLCFGLKKLEIDMGMGLGLFAIFGILRYRTEGIEIKEMTYLFLVIGLSAINALATEQISLLEMGLINLVLLVITAGLEHFWLLKHEARKLIIYDRIDLITPEKSSELKLDLEKRTGLKIKKIEIGKIDFLRDVAHILVYYDGEIEHLAPNSQSIE